MIDELLPYAAPIILVAELGQVIDDIDFLDFKVEEYRKEGNEEYYKKAVARRDILIAYRSKLMFHLKDKLGVA